MTTTTEPAKEAIAAPSSLFEALGGRGSTRSVTDILNDRAVTGRLSGNTITVLKLAERHNSNVEVNLTRPKDHAGSVSLFRRGTINLSDPSEQYDSLADADREMDKVLGHEAVHTIFGRPEIEGGKLMSNVDELISRMTKTVIDKVPRQFQDTNKNKDVRKSVEAEYHLLRKQVLAVYEQAGEVRDLRLEYGLTSPAEFVAEVLGNPKFAAKLRDVKFEDRNTLDTLLLRFRKMVALSIGGSEKDASSLLSAVTPALDRLLDN